MRFRSILLYIPRHAYMQITYAYLLLTVHSNAKFAKLDSDKNEGSPPPPWAGVVEKKGSATPTPMLPVRGLPECCILSLVPPPPLPAAVPTEHMSSWRAAPKSVSKPKLLQRLDRFFGLCKSDGREVELLAAAVVVVPLLPTPEMGLLHCCNIATNSCLAYLFLNHVCNNIKLQP